MVENDDSFLVADSIVETRPLQSPHPPHPHPAGGGGGGQGAGERGVDLVLHPAESSEHQTPANTESVITESTVKMIKPSSLGLEMFSVDVTF